MGQVRPIPNRDIHYDRENFVDMLSVALRNINTAGSIHYTVNGSNPTKDSPRYVTPIKMNVSTILRAACIVDGKPVGEEYRCDYVKVHVENNITTGKPVFFGKEISGRAIDNSAVVDGIVDINRYWEYGEAKSLVVDLQEITLLQANRLYTYWDNKRYYQYTIDISVDAKNWKQVVDRSKNTEKATPDGYTDLLSKKVEARYVRINMLHNSVNSSVHIVEWRLY